MTRGRDTGAAPPRRMLVAAALVVIVASGALTSAVAKPGDADPSFGSGGGVVTFVDAPRLPGAVGPASSGASDLIVQADGKLVAAGDYFQAYSVEAAGGLVLARYGPNGAPDTTFGNEGIVYAGDADPGRAEAGAILQQPDGRLVLAGTLRSDVGDDSIVVERFDADGGRDQSFASPSTLRGRGAALVRQPDGKLVLAGTATRYGGGFLLARLNPDGSMDKSFGSGGTVTTMVGPAENGAEALVIQPDGKLVTGGYAVAEDGRVRYALVRYRPDGSLDPTFGSGGTVITRGPDDPNGCRGEERISALAIQGTRIIAAGSGGVRRYTADGALDESFGRTVASRRRGPCGDPAPGSVRTSVADVVIDSVGRPVLAGSSRRTACGIGGCEGTDRQGFLLRRLTVDGAREAGFGSGGDAMIEFSPDCPASALAVAIDGQGRIVAAGSASVGSRSGFALARALTSAEAGSSGASCDETKPDGTDDPGDTGAPSDTVAPRDTGEEEPAIGDVRARAGRLRLRARQRRGRTTVVVAVAGRLVGTRGGRCAGRVALSVRAPGRMVLRSRARVGRDCRFQRRLAFGVRRLPPRLRPRGRRLVVEVRTRYLGSRFLLGGFGSTGKVRVRR